MAELLGRACFVIVGGDGKNAKQSRLEFHKIYFQTKLYQWANIYGVLIREYMQKFSNPHNNPVRQIIHILQKGLSPSVCIWRHPPPSESELWNPRYWPLSGIAVPSYIHSSVKQIIKPPRADAEQFLFSHFCVSSEDRKTKIIKSWVSYWYRILDVIP